MSLPEEPADSYLEVLFRHWRALLWTWASGASVVIGLSIINVLAWPWWALAIVAILGVLVAQWRTWDEMRQRQLETEGMLAVAMLERDSALAAEIERQQVNVDLRMRPLEQVSPDEFLILLEVENNGSDGSFVALVQEVHGLPSHFPIYPYGDFRAAWIDSTDEAVMVNGGGNKRVILLGRWIRNRAEFCFAIPHFPPHFDRHAYGPQFSPVAPIDFDLEVRDVTRQSGRRFHVRLEFDLSDRMPTAVTVTPVEVAS